MTNYELERRIKKININRGKVLIPKCAYLCLDDEYEIIILTNQNNEKVGGILRCGFDDIHFTIFQKYRNQHFLSNFLKTGVMQKTWKENHKISLYLGAIESEEDYLLKKHLVELTGYELKNVEEIERYLNYFRNKGRHI